MLPLAQATESLEVVDDWFHRRSARDAVVVLLRGCATRGTSFWAWDAATWAGVLGISGKGFLTMYPRWAHTSARSYAIALAYLFGFTELHFLGNVGRGAVARKVFGGPAVDQAVEQVTSVLHGWGQRSPQVTSRTASLVCHALLLNRSPLLADPILGQAIATWEAVRPTQPAVLDRKTSERVHLLFSYRAQGIGRQYLNIRIIPALCAKAGVPTADIRGNITSHRARSTIASQLYNAKEPMTLFELQAWLGHRSPSATQHYATIAPTTLAKAYSDAGYFARNVRTIEVLVDRDDVTSGATASGQPWQYYDLGHGYCIYSFFEQCPHRMACARCDFYTPKDTSKAQLLEAKENLQRMLASVPLTDDEQAAATRDRRPSTASWND